MGVWEGVEIWVECKVVYFCEIDKNLCLVLLAKGASVVQNGDFGWVCKLKG